MTKEEYNKVLLPMLESLDFIKIDSKNDTNILDKTISITNHPNNSGDSSINLIFVGELSRAILGDLIETSNINNTLNIEEGMEIPGSIEDLINTLSEKEDTPIITNGYIGMVLSDSRNFIPANNDRIISTSSIYKVGRIGNRDLYVNPYMLYTDYRILILNDIQLNYLSEIISDVNNHQTRFLDPISQLVI